MRQKSNIKKAKAAAKPSGQERRSLISCKPPIAEMVRAEKKEMSEREEEDLG